MNTRVSLVMGIVAVFATACGESPTEPTRDATPAADTFELAGDTARGEALYGQHCSSCHGADGRGEGPAGRALRPPPTNFATTEVDAERAYRVVKDGGMAAGLAPTMPPFDRMLDDQALRDVVAYSLSLHEGED